MRIASYECLQQGELNSLGEKVRESLLVNPVKLSLFPHLKNGASNNSICITMLSWGPNISKEL